MGGVTPSIRGLDAQWTSHMQGGVGITLSEWLSTWINDPMISDSKHEISEAYQLVTDKEGEVRSELNGDLPRGRSADEDEALGTRCRDGARRAFSRV
ncbi:hypothetical protein Pmar_PMAR005407 [Perkinsus marinus ATCC 50983]|uniref:Uncharacterized protein n=1 Tax=Perkinsus marinus (strain ATCC 50983 / TXsc) TaxID=423536 RepID=C5KBD7_PERM5|nr:hypothetical protein Pmar_PMAR005407 [Perkinsus marinus ATCC 50983]EER18463.1 hypothetical protein Pmar_PMAR005407 [Perkinsus marinus ATCC 50983]|eukprot:XP_002786667.1 hypothetical protein Pmar_PMAR005407 [Perkinsus marinus ATCC 50983]